MITNRDKIVDKVRAMMAKTVANGCTEAEALAAITMAQSMMDAYEITEDDLKLDDEKAIKQTSDMRDAHGIRWKLCYMIAKFTDTRSFGNKKYVHYVGLKSDVEFAIWLTEMLATFVQAELKKYIWANGYTKFPPDKKRKVINGFVIGCTSRINTTLRTNHENRKETTNSMALVVCKEHLIEDFMKDLTVKPVENRGRKTKMYHEAFQAGIEAGAKANFGRPIETENETKMIGWSK